VRSGTTVFQLGGALKFFGNRQAPDGWCRNGSDMVSCIFLAMFLNMIFQTYLVASKARTLNEAIKLFWTFEVPWRWTYKAGTVPDWIAQFSLAFMV